jgi:hypothetical protein
MFPKVSLNLYFIAGKRSLKLLHDAITSFGERDLTVTVELKRRKRSIDQNSYIHALFKIFSIELIKHTGDKQFTPTKMKGLCKTKFLLVDVCDSDGVFIGQDIRETSSLNTVECNEFIENIIQWAAQEFSIVLPYPNEQMEINMD